MQYYSSKCVTFKNIKQNNYGKPKTNIVTFQIKIENSKREQDDGKASLIFQSSKYYADS